MMYLITGKPGNGKTLKAMQLMRDEYERNKKANALPTTDKKWEAPRRFFSNVKGATTEENPTAFPWVELLPPSADWTKLPDGSYVQYDEAHSDGKTPGLERYGHLFPSTGKPGESEDLRIRAMSTHRHRGFDLVLITQWPTKIHHQVRPLVNQHIHMSRAFGLESAGVLTWHNSVQLDPYDEEKREKAEEEIWTYPADLYDRYISATLHTASHKFKMPKAIWKGLLYLVVGLAILFGFIAWIKSGTADKVEDAKASAKTQGQGGTAPAASRASSTEVKKLPGTGEFIALNTEALPRISGYILSPRGCRIWNDEGLQLDIAQDECVRMVERGIPVSFLAESRRSARREREEEPPQEEPVALPFTTSSTAEESPPVAEYGAMRGKDWPAQELTQAM